MQNLIPAARVTFKRVTSCGALLIAVLLIAAPLSAQTLPRQERPEWLRREGLIMAGSWEPLTYRTAQGTSKGHVPTAAEREKWEYEHSPEVTAKLKELGVNFVMMHCYKGAGLKVEHDTMQDAVRFAKQYHEAGLHVGVYVWSGTFLWEPLYREVPEAQNWALLDKNYRPIDYYQMGIRYYCNRNNPDAQAFHKKIVAFAVNDIKTDLLHFDNYSLAVGRDAVTIQQFRDYLRNTFTLDQLKQMGAADLSKVVPPMGAQSTKPPYRTPIIEGSPQGLLDYAWLEFATKALARSYMDMNKYARSLRKDVLMELNAGGPAGGIQPPKDFGRLLTRRRGPVERRSAPPATATAATTREFSAIRFRDRWTTSCSSMPPRRWRWPSRWRSTPTV